MTRTMPRLAALMLLLAAGLALAQPAQARPRRHHPVRIVRVTASASPGLFQPVTGVSEKPRGGGRKPHGITVTKVTHNASPVLFQPVIGLGAKPKGGGRKPHGITVTKVTHNASPGLFQPSY